MSLKVKHVVTFLKITICFLLSRPYLEVLSRFGLWRDFLNNNIQATISAFRLVKNMSVNPKSVEFYRCQAKPYFICFYNNIKDNDNENTESDSDFPFKTFCKLAKHAETIQKNVWERSNGTSSLLIRVQTTVNHISICFLSQYQPQRKCLYLFFRAQAEKGIARHTRDFFDTRIVCATGSNF